VNNLSGETRIDIVAGALLELTVVVSSVVRDCGLSRQQSSRLNDILVGIRQDLERCCEV
jgi:hypothetical protein